MAWALSTTLLLELWRLENPASREWDVLSMGAEALEWLVQNLALVNETEDASNQRYVGKPTQHADVLRRSLVALAAPGVGGKVDLRAIEAELRDDRKDVCIGNNGYSIEYQRGHRAGRWDAANAIGAALMTPQPGQCHHPRKPPVSSGRVKRWFAPFEKYGDPFHSVQVIAYADLLPLLDAARGRSANGHDVDCDAALRLEPDTGRKPGAACTCGHDALAAALEGFDE